MTRAWPLPPTARTLHCIGDLHFGAAPGTEFSTARQAIVRDDLARAAVPQVDFRLQLGDLTNTATESQDADGLAFMESLSGTPLYVVGNHDMWGVRTAEQAADRWGLPAKDYVIDLGFATLVVLGPDEIHENLVGLIYSDATLNWLDARLGEATKPVIVAAHPPLYGTVGAFTPYQDPPDGQYSSTDEFFYFTPDTGVRAVLVDNPAAVAFISGHTHSPITAKDIVKVEPVGGRTLAAINAGSLAYCGNSKEWTDPLVTMFVTVHDDLIQVRFRDHGAHQWVGGGPDGVRVWSVPV